MKRMLLLLVLVSVVGIALPPKAVASKTIVGRITGYSATSLSVRDKEILTVTLDDRTTYTKLITQKPWQEDTRLSAAALGTGRFVAVHVRKDNPSVADWVQIATDMRSVAGAAAPTPAFFAPQAGASAPTASKPRSSDLLTSKEVAAMHKQPAELTR